MGSPDFFLYVKHLSVFLEIPLKDFRGQGQARYYYRNICTLYLATFVAGDLISVNSTGF